MIFVHPPVLLGLMLVTSNFVAVFPLEKTMDFNLCSRCLNNAFVTYFDWVNFVTVLFWEDMFWCTLGILIIIDTERNMKPAWPICTRILDSGGSRYWLFGMMWPRNKLGPTSMWFILCLTMTYTARSCTSL